jgi:hypothetical protein
MGLFKKIAGSPEARAQHSAAKAELDRISRRDRCESDDYLDANDRVAQAEKALPCWRRLG